MFLHFLDKEAAFICSTEVQTNIFKSKRGDAGISFVNGGAYNRVNYSSSGGAHQEGLRDELLGAAAQGAQGCAMRRWGGTPLALESCARLESPPWQGRPDTENKGESIRERDYPEESFRTVGLTLLAEMPAQDMLETPQAPSLGLCWV